MSDTTINLDVELGTAIMNELQDLLDDEMPDARGVYKFGGAGVNNRSPELSLLHGPPSCFYADMETVVHLRYSEGVISAELYCATGYKTKWSVVELALPQIAEKVITIFDYVCNEYDEDWEREQEEKDRMPGYNSDAPVTEYEEDDGDGV